MDHEIFRRTETERPETTSPHPNQHSNIDIARTGPIERAAQDLGSELLRHFPDHAMRLQTLLLPPDLDSLRVHFNMLSQETQPPMTRLHVSFRYRQSGRWREYEDVARFRESLPDEPSPVPRLESNAAIVLGGDAVASPNASIGRPVENRAERPRQTMTLGGVPDAIWDQVLGRFEKHLSRKEDGHLSAAFERDLDARLEDTVPTSSRMPRVGIDLGRRSVHAVSDRAPARPLSLLKMILKWFRFMHR